MLQRDNIRRLAQELGETFFVSRAAQALGLSNNDTSKILSRWEKQGWIRHIRQGYFAIVPLDAISQDQPLENMWCIVPDLFNPGYIGGWSAAEHWDFTEQVFKDICVLTEKRIPQSGHNQEFLEISFFISHIPNKLNFGTEVIWIKNKKVHISDPHKTMLDMLYKPLLGGGAQHTLDCFKTYIKSEYFDPIQLIDYAKEMENGVVFKRLGIISEKLLGLDHDLTKVCLQQRTTGPSYMDPSDKSGHFHKKWQLYVPSNLQF